MYMEFLFIAIGIAAAGYFIGEGLRNFQSPNSKSLIETFDEDDDHELIKENNVHYFLGVTKEDAKQLISEYPNIPHILLNDKVYYQKAKLKEWLNTIGK